MAKQCSPPGVRGSTVDRPVPFHGFSRRHAQLGKAADRTFSGSSFQQAWHIKQSERQDHLRYLDGRNGSDAYGAEASQYDSPVRQPYAQVYRSGICSLTTFELRDRFGRSDDFYQTIFGAPVDRGYWRQNNPASIALDNAKAIAKSGIKLYLECGNADSFLLHHGTEFLHRCLFDRNINHEYRLIEGAEHIGPSLDPRFSYAFAFLDKALSGKGETVTPEITELREKVGKLKMAAGYPRRQEIAS